MSSTLENKPQKFEKSVSVRAEDLPPATYVLKVPSKPEYCDEKNPFVQVIMRGKVLGKITFSSNGKTTWAVTLGSTFPGAEQKIEEFAQKNYDMIQRVYYHNQALAMA